MQTAQTAFGLDTETPALSWGLQPLNQPADGELSLSLLSLTHAHKHIGSVFWGER